MRQKLSRLDHHPMTSTTKHAANNSTQITKLLTFKTLVLAFLYVLLTSSCASKKDIYYLQSQENISGQIAFTPPKIQVNDILNIKVTAENLEAATVFNTSSLTSSGNQNIDILKITGYLVSASGEINFPVLGTIIVTDKTINDLELFINHELKDKKLLDNPVVTARIVNSKVTITGEVKTPGTYTFTEQVLTLPQALGYAGDLTINGKRNNVLLIREENGERSYTNIDLTKSDFFKSPYYYVKQNDWIYVYPNAPKVASSGFIGNVGTVLGLGSFVLTITLLLTR